MGAKIDLTGRQFNRLTVIKQLPEKVGGNTVWLCECICGNEKVIAGGHIVSNRIKSCGCLRKEVTSKRSFKHGASQKTRLGLNQQLDYIIWRGMLERCYNKNATNYPGYGGRGIRVYEKWKKDFLAFRKYLTSLPNCISEKDLISRNGGKRAKLSIDRIDNNGDYKPGNIRWATPIEQSNNTRRNKRKFMFKLRGKL